MSKKEKEFIELLEKKYGFENIDEKLVRIALTHKSYSKEMYDRGLVDNEFYKVIEKVIRGI